MAIISSGDLNGASLSIGITSKAARNTPFDSRGNDVGMKAGYAAVTTAKTAVFAGTAPFFSIYGSATKTIRIHRIIVSATVATTAVYGDVVLSSRTVAISGGTATTLTQVPKDQTSAAGTATNVKIYTVAPTAGTG